MENEKTLIPSRFLLPAGVSARYNVKVPMRDGVKMSADIFFPEKRDGPFPVVLSRTPYDNTVETMVDSAVFYAQHGYASVLQDVRGRNDSEGEFYPWVNEFKDGHDTIEWIGAQEWCDGNVGMVGASHGGIVQNMASISIDVLKFLNFLIVQHL